MKKSFSLILLITVFLGFIPQGVYSSNDTYFVVTAYYSPLPNQKNYLRGNYEDEKILNGQGIRGASGKAVFSGMLAAPGKYSFGTKVYLEWLWVGEISDRGGAIVEAGKRGYSYDRIDVWMGYGDEWLRRALYWGKRTVKGNVIASNSAVTLDYSTVPAPLWATQGLRKVANVFHNPLGKWSNVEQVQELQKLLQETGFYKWTIDGVYNDEVIDIVYDFQIANTLMQNEYSIGAGYWGASTRNLFFKKYINGEFSVAQKETQQEKNILGIFETPLQNTESVKKLQEIFTDVFWYEGKIDGDYASIEKHILKYQLEKEIISADTDLGAGVFGPKTRASLKDEYTLFLEAQKRQLELEELYTTLEEESLEESQKRVENIGTPAYGDISTSVRQLQVLLQEIGYSDYKDTAIFWPKTQSSILLFQQDVWLIQTASDIGAGKFWPKTQEAMVQKLKENILQEKLVAAEIFEEIEALSKSEDIQEQNISVIYSLTQTL